MDFKRMKKSKIKIAKKWTFGVWTPLVVLVIYFWLMRTRNTRQSSFMRPVFGNAGLVYDPKSKKYSHDFNSTLMLLSRLNFAFCLYAPLFQIRNFKINYGVEQVNFLGKILLSSLINTSEPTYQDASHFGNLRMTQSNLVKPPPFFEDAPVKNYPLTIFFLYILSLCTIMNILNL